MSDWQPIETAPRDKTPIDLWVIYKGEGRRCASCIWDGGAWNCETISWGAWRMKRAESDSYGVWVEGAPTHWMPVPARPLVSHE